MSAPRILAVSAEHPDPDILRSAAQVLRDGGLVAFPTETVYGLGANALDPCAVARIFSAKGRPGFNPVIAHVHTILAAKALVSDWPLAAETLAAAFWPGPLTLVLPKQPHVPDTLTAGAPAVAVRLPSHPVALGLIAAAGLPVAAPSANRSSAVSPTTAQHVARSLGSRVDLILDAGPTGVGIESTVVDLTGSAPRILRPGPIGQAEIEALVGPLDRRAVPRQGEGSLLSPGLLDRHYAPAARVRLFDPAERPMLAAELRGLEAEGRIVGGMLLGDDLPGKHMLRMPDEPAGYARALYAALHQLDDLRCHLIVIEMVPDQILWAGVRDRIVRAATMDPRQG
ncbi:MAG: L-threonylcarbamoyladenylate synthase [Gemmatimonadota bacterium]|nr:L-threonylcarbamoyladenylate synthase [Gemmatimonadota bacterium]